MKMNFIKHTAYILLRLGDVFGASRFAKEPPFDREIEEARNLVADQMLASKNNLAARPFDWPCQLHVLSGVLIALLKRQSRLSFGLYLMHRFALSCKGLFANMIVIFWFITQKSVLFQIVGVSTEKRKSRYLIFSPSYCTFETNFLSNVQGVRFLIGPHVTNDADIVIKKSLSLSLFDLKRIFEIKLKFAFVNAIEIFHVVLAEKFFELQDVTSCEHLLGLEHVFVYEGTNSISDVIFKFAENQNLVSSQYHNHPFCSYDLTRHGHAKHVLIPWFSHNQLLSKTQKRKERVISFDLTPAIEDLPQKKDDKILGFSFDMGDWSEIRKEQEIREALSASNDLVIDRMIFKFHPQITSGKKLLSHLVPDKFLRDFPLASIETDNQIFFKSIKLLVTNSPSLLIQDSIMQGTPVIFYGVMPSHYIEELSTSCSTLFRACDNPQDFKCAAQEFINLDYNELNDRRSKYFKYLNDQAPLSISINDLFIN